MSELLCPKKGLKILPMKKVRKICSRFFAHISAPSAPVFGTRVIDPLVLLGGRRSPPDAAVPQTNGGHTLTRGMRFPPPNIYPTPPPVALDHTKPSNLRGGHSWGSRSLLCGFSPSSEEGRRANKGFVWSPGRGGVGAAVGRHEGGKPHDQILTPPGNDQRPTVPRRIVGLRWWIVAEEPYAKKTGGKGRRLRLES